MTQYAVLRLPFKDSQILSHLQLGKSYNTALRTFQRMESNFKKDEKLKLAYVEFMKEYLELNHVILDTNIDSQTVDAFFLPYHGVWKERSLTTKLRTVFNGYIKTPSGNTLNDLLHVGPNLLQNPIDLLCSWRRYEIALSADVEKMFRQILLDERDQKYQCILWRFNANDPVEVYRVATVTYSLSCSPFLAIRALLQLASDDEDEYPVASHIVRKEMYSDNVLTGAHPIAEATQKQGDLISLFKRGCLNLRKWTSNEAKALDTLPEAMMASDFKTLFAFETSVSVLGIS